MKNPLLPLLGLFAGSCLGQQPVELKPGQVEESCHALDSGQSVEYHFQASQPLEFNIHYHRGELVLYPVLPIVLQRVTPTSFAAHQSNTYCLMWRNRNPSVTRLRYSTKTR